jgi:hypothetical protein
MKNLVAVSFFICAAISSGAIALDRARVEAALAFLKSSDSIAVSLRAGSEGQAQEYRTRVEKKQMSAKFADVLMVAYTKAAQDSKVGWPSFEQEIADVYARHLTELQLRRLADFYASDIGKRFANEMPGAVNRAFAKDPKAPLDFSTVVDAAIDAMGNLTNEQKQQLRDFWLGEDVRAFQLALPKVMSELSPLALESDRRRRSLFCRLVRDSVAGTDLALEAKPLTDSCTKSGAFKEPSANAQ